MSVRHFLTLKSLNRDELESIINRALELKKQVKQKKNHNDIRQSCIRHDF